MADRHRLAVVLTHPVQYFSPWFRFVATAAREIDLRVFYGVVPSAAQQGRGFGTSFEWDQPLLDGYQSAVLGRSGATVSAESFSALDAPALDAALSAAAPDAVLIPGWHAALYRRAMRWCHAHGVPALYRGDSNLFSGPASSVARAAWRARTRRRLREYAAFLCVGRRAREYLLAFGASEPLIFDSPHAVDNAQFASGAIRRPAGTPFTALFAGKLEEKKRPLDVIRALHALPDVRLLVVGSGPLEAACRAAAAPLGDRVVFMGFVNQSHMGDTYAAADCLVLPSDGRETWGLVVNEAMAAGLPAVVSDRVGCQPDLVVEGETGAVFRCGDVEALAAAIGRLRRRQAEGHAFAARCRDQAARHDFAAATRGLVRACEVLATRARAADANRGQPTQVLVLCGHMVIQGGLERMTFEVARTLRRHGAGVHCLLNGWESSRIVPLAESAGVSWSVAQSHQPLRRQPDSVLSAWRMLREIVTASRDVLAEARRRRATHLLIPDFLMTIRAWPALALLRLLGRRIILRVGMAPPVGRFYSRLWRWGVSSVVHRMVANSDFLVNELRQMGIPRQKLGLIRNTAVPRGYPLTPAAPDARRIVYVGQIIPGKGVDVLIDALAALRQDGVAATLDIVGDMNGYEVPADAGYRARLRERAADPRLNGAVRFLGYRQDVAAVLGAAAVHCCPSRIAIREGLANVVLEAKASGVPSVVTRAGSLPELVEHRVTGWVADEDAASIAEGLRYFLEDAGRRERAGAAARSSLAAFSQTAFDEQWLREFEMQPS